jgi:hypothetical protein
VPELRGGTVIFKKKEREDLTSDFILLTDSCIDLDLQRVRKPLMLFKELSFEK